LHLALASPYRQTSDWGVSGLCERTVNKEYKEYKEYENSIERAA